ncbi:hypothetical protein L1282_000325 [Chryseobacterium sp. HSC-36S06]|nr:hypothetical protein [Chryseobacterium sp. HSC-36S06]
MNAKVIFNTIILLYVIYYKIAVGLFLNVGIVTGTLMEFSVIPLLIFTSAQLFILPFLWKKEKFGLNSPNFYAIMINIFSFTLLSFEFY